MERVNALRVQVPALVGFQSPKTIQSMDLGPKTLLFGHSDPLGMSFRLRPM